MSRAAKTSTVAELTVGSDNPVVVALQSFIKGLRHFNDRKMTLRHLKVLLAIKLGTEVLRNRQLTIKQIEPFAGLKEADFASELHDLIERNYVTEVFPSFGDRRFFSIGPQGGTILHAIIKGLDPSIRKT